MHIFFTLLIIVIFSSGCARAKIQPGESGLPNDFIRINDLEPSILEDLRYATEHNFIGKRIDGYTAPKCILTKEAAVALAKVQAELSKESLSLKIYDCYRPQQAVDQFVEWAKDLKDVKMKKEFYPAVEKNNLFKEGYIAEKSGHSRGSTVDLTLAPIPVTLDERYGKGDTLMECTLPKGQRFLDNSLDFGTGYDCFDPLAHTSNPKIIGEQKANRQKLKSIMEKHGFKNYSQEWWHFTLINEPFPNTYFNFQVE